MANIMRLYTNPAGNAPGIMNFYNNISYLQESSTGSYNMPQSLLLGISVIVDAQTAPSTTNIYHNTVYIDSIIYSYTKNEMSTAALSVLYFNGGSVDCWNNNFVNKDSKGVMWYTQTQYIDNPYNFVRSDYNNYYSKGDHFAEVYESDKYTFVATFDDWVFNNPSRLFNRDSKQDLHSRSKDPLFNKTADFKVRIDLSDINNVDDLITQLKPHLFFGGIKLPFPGTDKDIAQTARRQFLPTMGAIEVAMVNSWVGNTSSDWNDPLNWSSETVPADNDDVIFATGAERPLIMDGDHIVNDVYNDTDQSLIVNGHKLTLLGNIVQAEEATGRVDATAENSEIVYNGGEYMTMAQQIYPNSFVNDQVYNFTLNNESEYFVLLHDKLDIVNNFSIVNPAADYKGALNCSWYDDAELMFSGNITQYIPQYSIYKDSVSNLTINGTKVITNHDYLFVKNDLTINAGKNFEITADKYVKVDGNTVNNAGTSGLRIRTTADLPTATFIFNKNNTNVPAVVEMYSKADYNPNGEPGYLYKWQYFTSPVASITGHNFGGSWIREWDEAGDNTSGPPYWKALTNSSILSPFSGYEITQKVAKVYNIPGNLVNRDFSKILSYTTKNAGDFPEYPDQEPMNGQHVIGNPYTAAVEISALEFGANLDSTVYIFNTGSYKDWSDGGRGGEGSNPGQYTVVPQNNAGSAGLPSQIPSMQGFLVMRKNDGGSDTDNTFTLKYDAVSSISKNNTLMRAKPKERVYTIVDMESEHSSDRLWIFIEPGTKKGFDNGWDGQKFVNMSANAQLFTMEGNNDDMFQVSTMDDINETYLGIKPSEVDTEYTLTFQHSNMDELYLSITLTDLVADKTVDISESGSTYTFTDENANAVQKRFLITQESEPSSKPDVNDENKLIIYTNNNLLVINNKQNEEGVLYLYDISGKYLLTKRLEKGVTQIETSLPAGAYIVKAIAGDSNINKPIIIK